MHFSPLLCLAPLLLASSAAARKHKRDSCGRRHKGVASYTSVTPTYSPAGDATAVQANAKGHHTSTASASASSPTSTSKGSSSSSSKYSFQGPVINQIAMGWLPDDGSGGGQKHSIQDINSRVGSSKSSAQGYYAQAQSGTLFDGNQLLWKMDEIVRDGGVFQPAIMPTGGWKGLKYDDNSQAVAICKVLRQFTDKGLEVWLRFAHEVNWYQQDGTYQGTAADFKEGWSVVSKACKSIAPDVKMWFTPNIASLSDYQKYFPDDVSTVDLIGIDYYPQPGSGATEFIDKFKLFHDAYCNDNLHFAIGETGLSKSASMDDRLKWAKANVAAEVKAAMPYHIATSWFNYDKGYVFSIAQTDGDYQTKAWLQSAAKYR